MRTLALCYEAKYPAWAVCMWRAYLDDLRGLSVIPGRLKERAAAMIWARIGDVAEREDPDALAEASSDFYGYPVSPVNSVMCYRNSIQHYPDDRQTHEKLMEALVSRGSKKLAERAAADILKRWPTDVKSLLFLAKACFEQDAMRKALKYFDLARHAEPFNANVRKEMVSCLLFSARRRLDKGKLEMARRDYEHAEALSNSGQPDSTLYCKWAALEWRAGNAERAEALFAKALVGEVGALPVYYRMAIEAARAPAPAEVRDRVEKRLAQEWNSEPRAGDAAELVDVDSAHSDLGIRYPGRDVHVRELARYLERACGAVTFAEEQLLSICSYLNDGSEWGMLEAYAQKASEQCPGNYYFPLYLGRAQA